MLASATPLRFLEGVGPRRAEKLEEAGPATVEDLLYVLPFRWEDRRACPGVADLAASGAVFGTQQHGLSDLQFLAVALRDPSILEAARDEGRVMARQEGGAEAAAELLGRLRPGWKRRMGLAGAG